MQTLQALGMAGWLALQVGPSVGLAPVGSALNPTDAASSDHEPVKN